MEADLALGHSAEALVAGVFARRGGHVTMLPDMADQRDGLDMRVEYRHESRCPYCGCGASTTVLSYTVQVKLDVKSAESGLVFVETATEQVGQDGRQLSSRPSGLSTCKADYVMLVLPGMGILRASTSDMLSAAAFGVRRRASSRTNVSGSDRWRASGVLLPVRELVDRFGPLWLKEERFVSNEQKRHGGAYIWPTWVTGLLSGDDHCEWAAWYKAHFKYEKRQNESGDLSRWQAEHAEMVREEAAAIRERAVAKDVRIEDQNSFTVKGASATVGGKPDLVAEAEGVESQYIVFENSKDALAVVDCKTGKRKERDFWQMVIYILLVSKARGKRVAAAILKYKDGGVRVVSEKDAEASAALVYERFRRTGGGAEPLRTPSASECRFCDIARCPSRIEAPDEGADAVAAEF